jgi:glycosyltransferase involved in cell wall biosynthesis
VRKHPEFLRVRHLMPSAAVVTGAALLALAPRSRVARSLALALGAAYAGGALLAALAASRGRLKDVPLTAAAFPALHAGYGIGLLESPFARMTRPRAAIPGTKVVHLSTVHDPSDMRITYKECATLAQAGYDVVLIAPGELPSVPEGVRFRSVPLPANRLERSTRTMWAVYRAAREERADVYHFHDPELMFVGMLLQQSGARVVFDVHEDIPGDIEDKPWIPPALRKPVSVASAVALAALHRKFDAIVTATPAIARRFNHERMAVVNNYPRIEEFGDLHGPPFEQRPRRALYVGSITRIRCIDRIVESFSSSAMGEGIRLALAGRFENEALEAQTRCMPGWDRVDYLGFQHRGGVRTLLEESRVGLLLFRPGTNIDEALPTKLFEYLAAGLPVIVSTSLQCSRLVTDADCGIAVDSADVDAIARAMTELIDDPQRAQAMGERGRRLVLDGYVWESEAAKLTRLYADIVTR